MKNRNDSRSRMGNPRSAAIKKEAMRDWHGKPLPERIFRTILFVLLLPFAVVFILVASILFLNIGEHAVKYIFSPKYRAEYRAKTDEKTEQERAHRAGRDADLNTDREAAVRHSEQGKDAANDALREMESE